MIVRVKLDKGAFMPERAYEYDAGFDLRCRNTNYIAPHSSACFDTGVHVQIPRNYVGFLKSKSGLNVKKGLTGTGVIDCGYTGSIVVKLYNNTDEEICIDAGSKIIQLVILPIPYVELEEVETLTTTDRGENGFGSTGK